MGVVGVAHEGKGARMWMQLPSGSILNTDFIRAVHLIVEDRDAKGQPTRWAVTCEVSDHQWNLTYFASEDAAKNFLTQVLKQIQAIPVLIETA